MKGGGSQRDLQTTPSRGKSFKKRLGEEGEGKLEGISTSNSEGGIVRECNLRTRNSENERNMKANAKPSLEKSFVVT